MRTHTTRVRACAAIAAASQSTATRARKSVPGGCSSATIAIVERAVVAGRRPADEHRRGRGRPLDRAGEAACGEQAAVANALFLRRGPAPRRNRLAGEVDEGRRAADNRRPRPDRAVRGPRHRARAVAAQRSRTARQDDDLVAVLRQGSDERLSEKTGAAGNDNGHSLADTCKSEV